MPSLEASKPRYSLRSSSRAVPAAGPNDAFKVDTTSPVAGALSLGEFTDTGVPDDFITGDASFTLDAGVFWPKRGAPGSDWVTASDHRLVWVDLSRE